MKNIFRFTRRIAMALLLPLIASSALAAIPQTISYQGRLTNASDQPLGVPVPVMLSMTFKLFAAVSGGMALFSEQQSVVVNNGVFNVQIGASASLALAFDVPYFLEITIGAETLSPRQPLASAAYAFRTGCNPGDRVGCYSFATGAPGVGPCLAGVRVCNPQGTGYGACTGQVGPNCGSVCASLLTDNQNCGMCGNVCAGIQVCVNGACGSPPVVCGNGIIQSGETCDDGNLSNGDGCSSTCQVEPGFSCTGNPSVCTSTSSCMSPATCPGMDTECSVRTCSAGVCGVSYSMPGTVLASQTAGDCRKRVCGNMGVVNTVIDNSDFPASQACTIGLCVAGNPVNQAANDGTMCTIPATMTPGICNSGVCQ